MIKKKHEFNVEHGFNVEHVIFFFLLFFETTLFLIEHTFQKVDQASFAAEITVLNYITVCFHLLSIM